MTAEQWLAAAIVLLHAICGLPYGSADCEFGSTAGEGSYKIAHGQYIDLSNPLTCSGSIVAWYFCFYTDNIVLANSDNTVYTAYFRVYRRKGGNKLQRIHEAQRSLALGPQDIRNASFICMDDELEQEQYMNVSQGDYLAAYIPTLLSPLLIVGANTPGSLYRDNRIFLAFSSQEVSMSNLVEQENTTLHLYADVVNQTQVTSLVFDPVVSIPVTSTATTNMFSPATTMPASTPTSISMLALNSSTSVVAPTSTMSIQNFSSVASISMLESTPSYTVVESSPNISLLTSVYSLNASIITSLPKTYLQETSPTSILHSSPPTSVLVSISTTSIIEPPNSSMPLTTMVISRQESTHVSLMLESSPTTFMLASTPSNSILVLPNAATQISIFASSEQGSTPTSLMSNLSLTTSLSSSTTLALTPTTSKHGSATLSTQLSSLMTMRHSSISMPHSTVNTLSLASIKEHSPTASILVSTSNFPQVSVQGSIEVLKSTTPTIMSSFNSSTTVLQFPLNTSALVPTPSTSLPTTSLLAFSPLSSVMKLTQTAAFNTPLKTPSLTRGEMFSSSPVISQPPSVAAVQQYATSDSCRYGGLGSAGIAAIIVITSLLLTALILILVVLIVYLKKREWKQKPSPKKFHRSILSLDNSVYDLPSCNGPLKSPKAYEVPLVSLVPTLSESLPWGRQSYEALEAAEESQGTEAKAMEMHYEQATAEVFDIYASSTHPSSADFTTRIKKVVSSLKRSTAILYGLPAAEEQTIYQQLSQQNILLIPSDQIKVIRHLGSGQFAEVEKAWWISDSRSIQVAVKTLHEDLSGRSKVRCLQEAAMMAQFHHPNVVTLHGIIKENEKISLVMEFLFKGDLKQHLLRIRPNPKNTVEANTAQLLLSYSQQVALGMLYLSDKGFVHRDLAARNVFVSDRDICKIGDFGMSRDLVDAEYYISGGGEIPLKWTAPEAVYYHKYSTASDVWSYGCLLYEIWGMGHKPFVNMSNTEVLNKILAGFRLPPPPGCPYTIYNLMMACWNPFPDSRPSFQDILMSLLEDEQKVLEIPADDASTHPSASCLGTNLEAGYKMYYYLQGLYWSTNALAFDSPIYDSAAHIGSSINHGMVRVEERLEVQSMEEKGNEGASNSSLNSDSHMGDDTAPNYHNYACISDATICTVENTESYSGSCNSQDVPLLHSSISPLLQSIAHHLVQPGNGILADNNDNLGTPGE